MLWFRVFFFFSSRRRHTIFDCDWSSDVCSSDLPPSPQPPESRAAIDVLLQDLGRAVASERIANLKALYPAMTARDVASWRTFFRGAEHLSAKFTIEQLAVHGDTASAAVSGIYAFVPRGDGVQREDRPRFAMRFTKTPSGWRIASVREAK